MRRLIAFWIDTTLVSLPVITGAAALLLSTGSLPRHRVLLVSAMALLAELVYFLLADIRFHGTTLGKKLMGARLIWEDNPNRSWRRRAVWHCLAKCVILPLWYIGLLQYLLSGCRMFYDKNLGIRYEYRSCDSRTIRNAVIGTAAGLVLFLAVLVGGVFTWLSVTGSQDYYTIQQESVPSVHLALGTGSLRSYSSERSADRASQKYSYRMEDASSGAEAYAEYLIREDGFVRDPDAEAVFRSGVYVVSRPALMPGFRLQVTAADYEGGLLVMIDWKPE